jgi:hypothetical protein
MIVPIMFSGLRRSHTSQNSYGNLLTAEMQPTRRTKIEKGVQSVNPRVNCDFKAETTKESWICLRSLKVWVDEMMQSQKVCFPERFPDCW